MAPPSIKTHRIPRPLSISAAWPTYLFIVNTLLENEEVELGLWLNPAEFVLPCAGTHPSTSVCLSGSHTHLPKYDLSPVKNSVYHSPTGHFWAPGQSCLIPKVVKMNCKSVGQFLLVNWRILTRLQHIKKHHNKPIQVSCWWRHTNYFDAPWIAAIK